MKSLNALFLITMSKQFKNDISINVSSNSIGRLLTFALKNKKQFYCIGICHEGFMIGGRVKVKQGMFMLLHFRRSTCCTLRTMQAHAEPYVFISRVNGV